ncbi:uncharacterized protein [Gossypium hirsutum]|uniref:Uncharacterized protein n=1 Tax=Gossypium hirsutum TaxID=3635 RepID=A0A1U8HW22_GOSHI|nr:uncharacterized protein LOC107887825 [Gossypium hirsutum]
MAITLRSGTQLDDVAQDAMVEEDDSKNSQLKILESSEKHIEPKNDKQQNTVTESEHQLYINIPLIEALEHMPNYVKFMKDILLKKCRLREFETVALTEGCTVMLTNKLPYEVEGPREFHYPIELCDLRASINLMSISIFKKLGIGKARPITVMLQLAD